MKTISSSQNQLPLSESKNNCPVCFGTGGVSVPVSKRRLIRAGIKEFKYDCIFCRGAGTVGVAEINLYTSHDKSTKITRS